MELGTVILLILWGALASSVIVRLRRRGGQDFQPPIAPDKHRLVGSAALYLATPVAVLLSQCVQIALLERAGAGYTFKSWIYWGVVEPARADVLGPLARAAVAAAGPTTLLAVAALAFSWTRLRPTGAAHNLARLELGRFCLMLALGVHPLASLSLERGDFWTLRTSLDEVRANAGDGALLVVGVIAAFAFWRWRRAIRLRSYVTRAWDVDRTARARLAEDPRDPDALLTFGRAQLGAGDRGAIDTLERAVAARPDDPTLELWLGRANLLHGEPREASTHLRRAGELLEQGEDEDPPLLFAILFHLAEARMALGDGDGAVLTAEEAQAARPDDPLGLMLVVDTLVAMGRSEEAQERLVTALGGARGRLRAEIERRLAALERG